MPNFELMDRVLEQIETHPETWDQETWHCETGMCFAGWVCELSGYQWDGMVPLNPDCNITGCDLGCDDLIPSENVSIPDGERHVPIQRAACQLLGIADPLIGNRNLFDGDNTLADLKSIVSILKEKVSCSTSS